MTAAPGFTSAQLNLLWVYLDTVRVHLGLAADPPHMWSRVPQDSLVFGLEFPSAGVSGDLDLPCLGVPCHI